MQVPPVPEIPPPAADPDQHKPVIGSVMPLQAWAGGALTIWLAIRVPPTVNASMSPETLVPIFMSHSASLVSVRVIKTGG